MAGPAGTDGTNGIDGTPGAAGPIGPQGPAGTDGAAGTNGTPGAEGPIGPQGPVGPIGLQGPAGTDGTNGTNGTNGAEGPIGATGPAGSNGLAEYAYVYNLGAAVVAIEAPIAFDSNGVSTAGITHVPGTSDITLAHAGDYKVTFSVSGVEPSQFALFVNGVAVVGAIYGSGAGTQQTGGQTIITVGAGDVLSLRNHSSAAAVTLQTLAGGTQTNTNASITIEKLG